MSDNEENLDETVDTTIDENVNEEEDDPFGLGMSSSDSYIILGVCICLLLLCIIGLIYWMRSGSSDDDDCEDCDSIKIPTHFTVEFKYGEGVNPYNNFALPPVLPRPPEYFGGS
jgi:hypothetical protein